MIHDIPWQLLEQYFSGFANEAEKQQVKQWVESTRENEMIYEQLQHYYQKAGSLPIEFIPDTSVAFAKVSRKITLKPTIKLRNIWWKVAAVFFIGFCGWWFVHSPVKRSIEEVASVVNTDSTTTDVILSDGSHVWLNAHSSLKYSKKFGNIRKVVLEGEAYFEITRDPQHPFVIQSANTQTCVLGTKFNIRSYSSEKNIIVSVTEGKVSFGISGKKPVKLTQNQKGTYDKLTGNIVQSSEDNMNCLAWKTLQFRFDNQPLEIVFGTLSEVYHFKYQIATSILKKRTLTAQFNHRPVDEIFQTIALSADVTISMQNGTYLIK